MFIGNGGGLLDLLQGKAVDKLAACGQLLCDLSMPGEDGESKMELIWWEVGI